MAKVILTYLRYCISTGKVFSNYAGFSFQRAAWNDQKMCGRRQLTAAPQVRGGQGKQLWRLVGQVSLIRGR